MNLRLSTSCLLRDLHAVYDSPPSADLPRDIALFLIILAIGARADIHVRDRRRTREDMWRKGSGSKISNKSPSDYYYQCRAILSEVPMEAEPDVRVVKCVVRIQVSVVRVLANWLALQLLIAWYHASLSDHKDAGREATAAIKLAAKLALQVCLHILLSTPRLIDYS